MVYRDATTLTDHRIIDRIRSQIFRYMLQSSNKRHTSKMTTKSRIVQMFFPSATSQRLPESRMDLRLRCVHKTFLEFNADHRSCSEMTCPSLDFHTPLHTSHPRPVNISKSSQSSASIALDVIAQTAAQMARRAYIMHLFLPAATDKLPTGLPDPESALFTADHGRPVLCRTGSVSEAMIA